MGVITRPARPTDVLEWVSMRQALWPDESPDQLGAEAEEFFAGARFILEAVLLAEGSDGALLGFAELSRRAYAEGCETTPVAFLEGWYVSPAARGRGVGRELIKAAEQWAREQGCSELGSDTPVENTASAAAHQAVGFEDAGVLRCFRKAL